MFAGGKGELRANTPSPLGHLQCFTPWRDVHLRGTEAHVQILGRGPCLGAGSCDAVTYKILYTGYVLRFLSIRPFVVGRFEPE